MKWTPKANVIEHFWAKFTQPAAYFLMILTEVMPRAK